MEVSVARYLRTPINQAARAKSSDAKLSFAFTLFGLCATNRVTPISYYLPVDPNFIPIKSTLPILPIRWERVNRCARRHGIDTLTMYSWWRWRPCSRVQS